MSLPSSPNTCGLCGVRQLADVSGHALSEHARLPLLECGRCGYVYRTRDECEAHFSKLHQGEGEDACCAVCDMSFASESALDDHLRAIHAASQPLKCDLCGHCCEGTDGLDQHIAAVHAGEWRTCVRCCFETSHRTTCGPSGSEGSVPFVSSLEDTSVHVQDGDVHDDNDDGETQSPSKCPRLRPDPNQGHGQKMPQSPSCEPSRDADNGIGTLHAPPLPSLTDTNSDRTSASVRFYVPPTLYFKTEGSLAEHVDAIHSEQGYHCDICDLVSESQDATRWHRSISHPTALPWRCELCNLRFRLPENLKAHVMQSHPADHEQQRKRLLRPVELAGVPLVKVKLYVCGMCSRTFGTSDSAARHHEVVHAPMACRICGAEFGDRKWLSYHERQCEVKLRIGCMLHFPEYMILS